MSVVATLQAGKLAREGCHQHGIARATSAHEEFDGAVRVRAHGIGERARGERNQRRLHVLVPGRAIRVRASDRIEPLRVEEIAPGALGRRQCEVGFVEQRGQQRRLDAARGAPCAVGVERAAAVARVPEIEQHVAGTRVETAHETARRKVGDVRDAADVGDDAVRDRPGAKIAA